MSAGVARARAAAAAYVPVDDHLSVVYLGHIENVVEDGRHQVHAHRRVPHVRPDLVELALGRPHAQVGAPERVTVRSLSEDHPNKITSWISGLDLFEDLAIEWLATNVASPL